MAEPFWQRSLNTIDYEALMNFADEGVPENDNLEYKQATYNKQSNKLDLTDEFLETLVAFANSSGGMIILGIAEDSQTKAPASIPGIKAARDPSVSLRDMCAGKIEPQLSLETHVVEIPAGAAEAGNKVLLARVRRGLMPPYNLRTQGIFIRNGDMDLRASVREIEALFARRTQSSSEAVQPWHRVMVDVFGYTADVNLGPQHCMIGLAPAFPIEPIALTDEVGHIFRELTVKLFGSDGPYTFLQDGVAYTPQRQNSDPDVPYACAYADGTIGLRALLHLGPPAPQHLPLPGVWLRLREALLLAQRWPCDVCHYGGPLLCRVAITGLANVSIEHPAPWTIPIAMPTVRNRIMTWETDAEWDGGRTVDDLLEEILVSLARQLQYPSSLGLIRWARDQIVPQL